MVAIGENSLVDKGIAIRIGRFPVQILLGTCLGLMTQSHYETPSDLQVKVLENVAINIRLVTLSHQEWPKGCRGTAK